MLGFIIATLGVVGCVFVGLVLLPIPKCRHLAPYAFLVYPSAYVAGFVCFLVVGLVANAIAQPDATPIVVTMVLVIFGAGALAGIVGALTGFSLANRLWWRFFSTPKERAARTNTPTWLAMTPFEERGLERLFQLVRLAWNGNGAKQLR
jgi:hypothetical protein